jgi:hypothetical protein
VIYDFIDKETGEPAEFNYPMSEAPPLDSEVVRDGRTYIRVVSPEVGIAPNGFNGDWLQNMRCPSLPPWATDKHDRNGVCIVENAREAREIAARHGLEWNT